MKHTATPWSRWLGLTTFCIGSACSGATPATSTPAQAKAHSAGPTDPSPYTLPELPLRGSLDAELTLISILDFEQIQGRAMFAALDQVQSRLGQSRVRWVLLSRTQIQDPADTVLQAVQDRAGGAGSFAYLQALSERAAAGTPLDFAERLQLGLQTAHGFARSGELFTESAPRVSLELERAREQHALELEMEMVKLSRRPPAACLLSLNGIHVRGLPRATQLEQWVTAELQMVDGLRKRGFAQREVFEQRVKDNRDQFTDLELPEGPGAGHHEPAPVVVDPDDDDSATSTGAWRTL